MITFEVFVQGKFMTFQESLVDFEFTLRHAFFAALRALREPIRSVDFKFACETSCSFSGNTGSQKRNRSQSSWETCCLNLQHCIVTNVVIRATMARFRLSMQQCCETSRRKMLPVLMDLNKELKHLKAFQSQMARHVHVRFEQL